MGDDLELPAPVLTLLDHLDRRSLTEIERLLGCLLASEAGPAEARQQALGALMELRVSLGRRPQRREYDALRPLGSPLSRTLSERFGSWARACRAAETESALAAGETPMRPLRAWPNPTRTRRRPPNYTREEVIAAVIECWKAIGRLPSSNAYYDWVRLRRRHARQNRSTPPRLPTQHSVERHFKGWAEVRAAAETFEDERSGSGR